jgi:golgi phosphoprotein 3
MLNLPQKLFLLSIEDAIGKLIMTPSIRYGLAGGRLIDLTLLGKVGVVLDDAHSRKGLMILDSTFTGDEILDRELAKIQAHGKEGKITSLVNALGWKTFRKQVADSLVQQGAITREAKCYRWVIPYGGGLPKQSSVKYWLKGQLRGCVLAGEPPDVSDVSLLGLLRACHLLNLVFTKDERKWAANQVEILSSSGIYSERQARTVEAILEAVEEFSYTKGR